MTKTIDRQTVDEEKLGEFMGQMVGHMTGSALCFAIWLGDELGLYRLLAARGPSTASDLARAIGMQPQTRA